MIIATKGTKTDEAAQEGVQGLARRAPEAKSRLPYVLGLAVAAVAAYLKSLFHEPARAEAEGEGAEPPGAASLKPVLLLVSDSQQDEELPDPDARGSSAVFEEAQVAASALEYDVQEVVRAQSLLFSTPETRPDLGDFKPSPIIPSPINDNRDAAPSGGGGGGGRGHGGGGRETPSQDNAVARPYPVSDDAAHSPDKAVDGVKPDGTSGEGGGTDTGGRTDAGDGAGGLSPADPSVPGDPTGGRRNRAPVSAGTVQLADTTRCASVAIAALDLLRTVSDPDGDALAIRNVTTSSGTLVRDGDGWLFDADAAGSVTFTYEVTDGEFVIAQTATLNVVDHASEPGSGGDGGSAGGTTGTGGDDLILGTPFPDRIDGGTGDDNIDARGGADFVDGGPGDDNIVGGAGDDTILGGLGHDVIFAGAGRDVVSGGDGNDRIFGEDGDDTLFGDDGDDVVDGGAGSDILVGGNGDDALHGGEGDDRLDGSQGNDVALAGAGTDVVLGGAGDDRLEGGEGDDLISDGTGRDSVLGQEGDDVLAVALDGEADTFDGGDGVDTLDLTAATSGVAVDLAAGTAVGTDIGTDRVVSVDIVRGGSGADTLTGDAGANALYGGDGQDHLAGGSGDDLLDGGSGRDAILDGAGRDVVHGGEGDDLILLATDADDDRVDGGGGSDTLDLGGAAGDLLVDLVRQVVSGTEIGDDQIESIERIVTGAGQDHFIIGDDDVVLTGGGGDDRYEFASLKGDREPTHAVQITDFSVGDHIDLLKWTFFEAEPGSKGESLAEAMERKDGTVSGIRYKSAQSEDCNVTVISADFDHDDLFETTIVLDGQHSLLFSAVAPPAIPPNVTPIA